MVCFQSLPHLQHAILDDCSGLSWGRILDDEPSRHQAFKKVQYKLVELFLFLHVEEMPCPVDDHLDSAWNLGTQEGGACRSLDHKPRRTRWTSVYHKAPNNQSGVSW
jgi:hypothetical protein